MATIHSRKGCHTDGHALRTGFHHSLQFLRVGTGRIGCTPRGSYDDARFEEGFLNGGCEKGFAEGSWKVSCSGL